MSQFSRRDFIKLAGAAGLSWPLSACTKNGKTAAKVVVVGGGFGGSTCAKYLRRFDSGIDITLIERDTQFVTCPFSNAVLGGLREIDDITHGYDALRDKYAINVVHDSVTAIDPVAKTVTINSGKKLTYDRLVLSPGIDFRWGAIEGYDQAAVAAMPHAWKAGAQTLLLRKQLDEMNDGGVVIISAPDNPFRCPPGPYERASMIGYYLKLKKPKSKILILDAKGKFSKQPLFMQAWEERYPGMIEWVKGSEGGNIVRADTKTMTLYEQFDKSYKGDVINVIPPQQAGEIAHSADLVNNDGWCPVDQRTFESTKHKDIHVIGDAAIAGQMPKSGFAANSQGKVCAAAVVTSLRGEPMPEPSYVNTCYSLIAPDYGISVAAVYRVTDKGIVKTEGSGGVSPMDADESFRKKEADFAAGWYASITSDMFS